MKKKTLSKKEYKHHHIYPRYSKSDGTVLSYKVAFQNSEGKHSKTFSFKNYHNPIKEALLWRDTNIAVKRLGCTTGIVGVSRARKSNGRFWYRYYATNWYKDNDPKKQKCKYFIYASEHKETGVSNNYLADLEMHAFRCASHTAHVVAWYKRQGILDLIEYDFKNKVYPNLKNWKTVSPEQLFEVSK